MNIYELQDVLTGVSYKPGWEFSAEAKGPVGSEIFISVEISARCVNDDKPIKLEIHRARSSVEVSYWDERDVLLLIRELITKVELHEMDEWLKYMGRRLTCPHPGQQEELALCGTLKICRDA